MGWFRRRRDDFAGGCDACSDVCDGPCDACDLFTLSIPAALLTPRSPLRVRTRAGVWAQLGIAAIRCYQLTLSTRLPISCRYEPSCSRYGAQALRRYGLRDGAALALARIRRCRPEVQHGTTDPLR